MTGAPVEAADRNAVGDEFVKGTGHVLVVDDDEAVRNFVSTSLKSLGYTVSLCADGVEGVECYRRRHREIDMVILDLIMPKMNGLDAFRKMKEINPNVKVLVSSGFSHTQATHQMLAEGALTLLNKPFQMAELSQEVADHIQCDSQQ
jgi:DNA-binding NtrC family response regulator